MKKHIFDKIINSEIFLLPDKKKSPSLIPLWSHPKADESCIGILKEHNNFIGSIVPYTKKKFVSSSEDCQMIVWDLESKKSTKILTVHAEPINYMCLSPDGNQLISASDDSTLKLWDINTWEVICTFEGHTDYVSKAAIAPGGLVVSVSKDQTVKVWDSNTGYCLHTLQGHNSWVYMLAVSPDGSKAITASVNGTMIVWDLINGTRLNTIVDGGEDVTYVMGLILDHKNLSEKGHKEYPLAAKWLKDGRIITVAKDIIIWDDKNFTELKRLQGDPWKIHDFVVFNNNN